MPTYVQHFTYILYLFFQRKLLKLVLSLFPFAIVRHLRVQEIKKLPLKFE